MKQFVIKTLLFFAGLIVIYSMIYTGVSEYLNSAFNRENSVFVWGDSEAYQGIDLNELSSTLGKKVLSSAHHGGGIYDFLLFTQQVPENAEVLVGISKLVQVRRKEKDFNRSGFSLWSMGKLYQYNYSISDIFTIANKNLKPKRNILESIGLYAYADTMKIDLPLSHFESYYEEIPSFLEDKQQLYLEGIQNLKSKNCTITLLEFPHHGKLVDIELRSPIQEKTDQFRVSIIREFDEFAIDTIHISKERNIFRDLSHLNGVGAKDLSRKLGMKMLENKSTTLYIAL